jgi:hypothetical protein
MGHYFQYSNMIIIPEQEAGRAIYLKISRAEQNGEIKTSFTMYNKIIIVNAART